MKPFVYIVGAGGVGSWLTPSLCLLLGKDAITVIDGDRYEFKNLNRQLCKPDALGKNKAVVLSETYGCSPLAAYYGPGLIEHLPHDLIVVCADNNPARLSALGEADRNECRVVVAANERTSAEAYYYVPDWKDSPRDPRVYYPELTADHSGDPLARVAGCTGQAQAQTPQLVSANFMAAALAQWLIVLWLLEAPKLDPDVRQGLPYKLVANLSRLETFTIKQNKRKQ